MLCELVVLILGLLEVLAGKKPHILYVVMDDQGYGDVGYTNQTHDIKTPLLDKLAREGLILNRHYAAWMCTPTRASVMTGRYPISLGIQHDVFKSNNEECLPEHHVLMPEIIRSNGYKTHMVGKWHLGYARWSCMPCMRGFDSFYGYTSGSINYKTHELESYYDFMKCRYSAKNGVEFREMTEEKGVYSLYLYNKRVKEIVDNHNTSSPLFLYLAMQSVHSPYYAPSKYYSCHSNNRCTMQAMLKAAEELLADVIKYFKAAGLWQDTLLIFHSDNGAPSTSYSSNGNLRGSKGHLWEGGVRTLGFLYSLNKNILPNRGFTNCYVHVSDWYKTIISISGGWHAFYKTTSHSMPDDLDSIDQSNFLIYGKSKTCPRDQIMLHIDPVKRVAGYYKREYKLLVGNQDSSESCSTTMFYPLDINSIDLSIQQLFNIYDDPNETTDIASKKPAIKKELLGDIILFLSHQKPLQCQLPTVAGSYPSSSVPFYLPWDFSHSLVP